MNYRSCQTRTRVMKERNLIGKRDTRSRTVIEQVTHQLRHIYDHSLRPGGIYIYHAVNIIQHIHIEVRIDLGFQISKHILSKSAIAMLAPITSNE